MMQRSLASLVVWAGLPLLVTSCTDSKSSPPAQGGAAELTFAGESGSNLDTSPLPATNVGLVAQDAASHTRVIGVFAYEPAGSGFQRKDWQLALTIIGDPVAGGAYTIGSGSAVVEYDQYPTSGSWLSWQASGGSISVESVSGTKATFSLSSIPMAPTTGGSGNEATGTFTFGGTIEVDNLGP